MKPKNIFNMPGKTKDQLLDEQVRQQTDGQLLKEEMMISQLPPDQQEAARSELFRRTMNQKFKDPLQDEVMKMRGQTQPTPEQQALMQRRAMEHFNSPEAKALRSKFGGEPQSQEPNLAAMAGLLDQKPRLRRPAMQEPETTVSDQDLELLKRYQPK